MARTTHNSLTYGYGGRMGDTVLRFWNGLSILQKPPDFSSVRWSRAQKANRKRFAEAMAYARKTKDDAGQWNFYERLAKKRTTPWNMAVSDYMLRPKIRNIDAGAYSGKPGDIITVQAADRYRIAAVLVFVFSAQGIEIESGLAVRTTSYGSDFVYRCSEPNAFLPGTRIVAKVIDGPGNTVQGEFTIGSRQSAVAPPG